MLYRLIAARDGDIIHEDAEWPDETLAFAWAAGVMALSFGLDPEEFNTFETVAPQTDGCRLIELAPDPVAKAAVGLVDLLSPTLALGASKSLLGRDARQLAIIEATAQLARTLTQAGYSSASRAG